MALFLNNVEDDYETDFGLFNLIQTLKYKVFRPLFSTPKLKPLILVPGLGASTIYATWNKSEEQTPTSKFLDGAGVFEASSEWSCRTLQTEWVPIWSRETANLTGVGKYCLSNNLHVVYDAQQNDVANSPGVRTYVSPGWELATGCYNDFIKALESVGYTKESLGNNPTNLLCANYDFRRMCGRVLSEYIAELTVLIESSVTQNGQRAILVGHDLGSQIANYFLGQMPKEWKDAYIDKFIVISGTFGGCPKALRTLLSPGDPLDRETQRNFCGLLWMLPCPEIYGDLPLVNYRGVDYTAKQIPQLLHYARYGETNAIHANIVHNLQMQSMRSPGVSVSIFSGNKVPTESNYAYDKTLLDPPVRISPKQDNELGYRVPRIEYPSNFNGDGTVPKFVLEHPAQWSRYQREPVIYSFYDGLGHNEVLSRKDSVQDIIGSILS